MEISQKMYPFGILFSLYLAQGIPAGLIAHALPALFRSNGLALEWIGLLKLLALPWLFKFLWAVWVDYRSLPLISGRKGWMVYMQLAASGLLLMLAFLEPSIDHFDSVVVLFLILLSLNFVAATQDIATDGWAVKSLGVAQRGLGNTIQVAAYKIGMLVCGYGFLLLVPALGWTGGFLLLSAVMCLLIAVPLFSLKNTPVPTQPENVKAENTLDLLRSYFGNSRVLAWFVILMSFKVADALGSSMIKPMLIDLKWSLSDVAMLGFSASLVGLVGAGTAVIFLKWVSGSRALLYSGALQLLGIVGWYGVSMGEYESWVVYAIAWFEQFADGLSTVVLFSIMMSFCREKAEGFDFSIQACFQAGMSGLLGVLSGFLAGALGYSWLYVIAIFCGVIGLFLIVWLRWVFEKELGRKGSELLC